MDRRQYGRRETGDKEVYGWQMVGQPSHTRGHVITDFANASQRQQSAPLPLTRVPTRGVSAHASTPEVGILQTRCLYACLRRFTAASGPLPGQGCLVSDIDCISACSVRTARLTVHDCGSASRCPYDGLLLLLCLRLPIVANAHAFCNSLMTRLTLARAYPTVRCSSCQ